jgi:uncharacterized cupin superfamily protein
MKEARLEDSGSGLAPAEEGWFVVNVRDATWLNSNDFGSGCIFDGRGAWFKQVGINISVLMPGEPNCLYHSESQQEAFLVLFGEGKLLVEGEERPVRQWDFVHCPAGTEHVFVGAGDGPCAILMVGARTEDEQLLYPVSELAAQYGASAEEETPSGKQAYARFEQPRNEKPPYWDQLPWA